LFFFLLFFCLFFLSLFLLLFLFLLFFFLRHFSLLLPYLSGALSAIQASPFFLSLPFYLFFLAFTLSSLPLFHLPLLKLPWLFMIRVCEEENGGDERWKRQNETQRMRKEEEEMKRKEKDRLNEEGKGKKRREDGEWDGGKENGEEGRMEEKQEEKSKEKKQRKKRKNSKKTEKKINIHLRQPFPFLPLPIHPLPQFSPAPPLLSSLSPFFLSLHSSPP
jgi:hypothetical protein